MYMRNVEDANAEYIYCCVAVREVLTFCIVCFFKAQLDIWHLERALLTQEGV